MGCLCWLSAFLAPAAACLAFYLAAPCLPPGALESVAALIVLQGVCWAAHAEARARCAAEMERQRLARGAAQRAANACGVVPGNRARWVPNAGDACCRSEDDP